MAKDGVSLSTGATEQTITSAIICDSDNFSKALCRCGKSRQGIVSICQPAVSLRLGKQTCKRTIRHIF